MKVVLVAQIKNINTVMDSCSKISPVPPFAKGGINVVIGLLINQSSQEILMTQRALHLHQGGLWEFPGGKIEPEETPEAALVRELREEIAIDVEAMDFLFTMEHYYPDKHVRLYTYRITHYTGVPKICDGQLDLRWISLADWNNEKYPLPLPNQCVMSKILSY